MSLFLGLGDNYKGRDPGNHSSNRQQLAVSPAQVLDVCMNENSPLYKDPSDIGTIRYRLVGIGEAFGRSFENEVTTIAYPLDRSISRYPLPGEQVIIYSAIGDQQRKSADHDQLSAIPFYSMVVSSQMNVTYNSHPFMGHNEKVVERGRIIPKQEAQARFDQKVGDLSMFKSSDNQIKIFKQLRPYEGDFILQGRFGNTIRFGSTSAVEDTPWATFQSGAPGSSGDPIMVLRVDRNNTVSAADMFITENPNSDDSSIYMCSSQRVEINLSCASSMKTWGHTLATEDKTRQATKSLIDSVHT